MDDISEKAKLAKPAFDRRMVVGGLLIASLGGCEASKPPLPKTGKQPAPAAPAPTHGLIELITLEPSIRLDLRYATSNNFTGRVLYAQARAFMVAEAADALIRAHHRARAEGYGLTIFDAYRPWHVTKALWDATPVAQHPYVANPKEGSRHNRGCAVDLTLHALRDSREVEMPSGFDDFSERAHRDFMGASAAAIANRARLARHMEAEGFEGRWDEWWHFDYRGWRRYPVLDVGFERM